MAFVCAIFLNNLFTVAIASLSVLSICAGMSPISTRYCLVSTHYISRHPWDTVMAGSRFGSDHHGGHHHIHWILRRHSCSRLLPLLPSMCVHLCFSLEGEGNGDLFQHCKKVLRQDQLIAWQTVCRRSRSLPFKLLSVPFSASAVCCLWTSTWPG